MTTTTTPNRMVGLCSRTLGRSTVLAAAATAAVACLPSNVCTTILVNERQSVFACVGTSKLNCVVASLILRARIGNDEKYEPSEMKGKQANRNNNNNNNNTTSSSEFALALLCGGQKYDMFFFLSFHCGCCCCFYSFGLECFNESKWKSAFCFKLRRYFHLYMEYNLCFARAKQHTNCFQSHTKPI